MAVGTDKPMYGNLPEDLVDHHLVVVPIQHEKTFRFRI